jgi:CDGSH-type Zn-finger protein
MTEPVIAGRAPLPIDVTAGKDYFWCTCGQSKNQPFCDGSHAGSTFTPQKWTAPETKTAYFCACKHTANAPLCDGSHAKLAG